MSMSSSSSESEATRRFEAERDAVEFSPAQPTGPDRIDDDDAVTPPAENVPPNLKPERGPHMEH
jgi:hypothetical protein